MVRRLIFSSFVFLTCVLQAQQKYSVRQTDFVYEILDSSGHSVYQCFADTVILMYKNKYGYIVKDDKVGLYSIYMDSLVLNTVYDEIWINHQRNSMSSLSAYPVIRINNIGASKVEFIQKGRRVADIIDQDYYHSVIKIEPYSGQNFLLFEENYHKDVTEPYYRILPDGIRIDSLAVDVEAIYGLMLTVAPLSFIHQASGTMLALKYR